MDNGYRTSRLRLEYLEDRSVPSTFTVNTTLDDVTPANGKFSIREAISKANAQPGLDTIVLPAGVFKIGIDGVSEALNATGDFDVSDAVTIQGAGAGLTVIDGQNKDRLFDVSGSFTAKFVDLSLRHGDIADKGGAIRSSSANIKLVRCTAADNRGTIGGAVSVTGANLTAADCAIARNAAVGDGGGIFVSGGTLSMSGSTVRQNLSGNFGGGVSGGDVTLTNCTISGNTTEISGGGLKATTANLTGCTFSGNLGSHAGGVYATTATLVGCTLTGNTVQGLGGGLVATTSNLTDCSVSGNSAKVNGGGIYTDQSTTLKRCKISGNYCGSGGGGIHAQTATVTGSTISGNSANDASGGGMEVVTATVRNSTISGNSAGVGGGIFASTSLTLINSTISRNLAANSGGGIQAKAASLINCTVAENTAHLGGGIHAVPGGTFSLLNTIVALNVVDGTGFDPDIDGVFVSAGHNLIGDASGSSDFTNGVNGDIVGTGANPIDPKLGALSNNGGLTNTYALMAGSPAIDHGTDVAFGPSADQRGPGFARKKDGNGDGVAVVDIGAFER